MTIIVPIYLGFCYCFLISLLTIKTCVQRTLLAHKNNVFLFYLNILYFHVHFQIIQLKEKIGVSYWQ